MIIHQALFGDKAGSYALISASLNTDEAKRLCNITDLLDRPSAGHLTKPVVRGFAVHDSYLFIKSFPDNDPGVRKGRVLSHTLIVDQEDLNSVNDIRSVFNHFISVPNKNEKLKSFEIENSTFRPRLKNIPTREAFALNCVLNHSSYGNVIVWVGEAGYLSLIRQVWSQLSGELRSTLRIGVGFNPQRIDAQKLSLIYVPQEYESKWKTGEYCVVGQQDRGSLDSMASFLLAGREEDCKPLRKIISDFHVVPKEIEDFRYLETGVATYESLSPETEFIRIIILCDLVSKYSPDQMVATKNKRMLLSIVKSRIPSATANQLPKLRNVDWSGFPGAEQEIGRHIAGWVVEALGSLGEGVSTTALVDSAFDAETDVDWWAESVSRGLKRALNKWKPNYAILVWDWFSEQNGLVQILDNIIPATIEVETALVRSLPKLSIDLAKEIILLAKRRNWLTLHGLSTLQVYDTEKSFCKQLEIDTDPNFTDALSSMSNAISGKEFLGLVVALDDGRLTTIASEKVMQSPKLINQIDVTEIVWRKVWLLCIENGMHPYKELRNPDTILFSLLDELLGGEEVDPKLVAALGTSGLNDISRYNRRSRVWGCLDERTRRAFLLRTAVACIHRIDDGDMPICDLEDELRKQVSNVAMMREISGDSSISSSTKILLFEELPSMKESTLFELIRSGRFSQNESQRIGKLVLRHRWRKAAEVIGDLVSSRKDLKPALLACESLLGFLQKMSLLYTEHLSRGVSTDEWWSNFLSQCYTKYPRGPLDKGLWVRSNGDEYDLQTFGSGREIWMDVISKMRSDRVDVSIETLLAEMRKDFPHNIELKYLERSR